MSVLHLTTQDFDAAISGSQPVLVDFFATWCGPCKMLSPVIEQIAAEKEGSVTVCKVDIDEQMALAERFNVQSVPTVILFQNGKELNRLIGYHPKSALLSMIG